MITTVADLIEVLKTLPQDLPPYITNGDLPDAPVVSATVQAAEGYGQMVLISRA